MLTQPANVVKVHWKGIQLESFEIGCTEFQAVFISPQVHSLIAQGKTVNSFWIENRNERIEWKRIGALLERLINGHPMTTSESDDRTPIFLGCQKLPLFLAILNFYRSLIVEETDSKNGGAALFSL
jgi:hypothetical protein